MALGDAWDRVRGLLSRGAMEREIADEVAFHIERETERNLRAGLSPSEARRQALIAFGGTDLYVEASREEHRSRLVEDFLGDVRVAARGLRRTPAFALVAMVSLAVGIGANAAAFSVVHSVLLRPLPYAAPGELVRVGVKNDNQEWVSSLSEADHLALMEAKTLGAFGAWGTQQGGFAVRVDGGVESVPGAWATAGLFRALGVAPHLGRPFIDDDHAPGSDNAVLLSHGFWQDRFGGARDVVDGTIEVDGVARRIVGVMPEGFQLPGAPGDRLWIAPELTPPEWRAPFWLNGVARLAPTVSAEAAATELAAVRSTVLARYAGSMAGWRYAVDPLKETLVTDARLTLLVLFAAVGLVLVIAAANVANLLLARAMSRAPELAVRSALGAGRGRLARQLLAESVLLGGIGGALGLALAWVAVRLLPAIAPVGLPRREEIALDGTVLAFALATTLVVGLFVGVLPAFRATRIDLITRIREGGRGGSGGRRANARAALVILEFALAVAIVVGAGLVVNSLARLQRVDAGIDTERLLTVRIAIPESRYPDDEGVASFFDPLVEQVSALPGVEAAGLGMAAPPNRLVMRNPFTPQGKVYATDERAPVAAELLVDPGFFEALGIRPTRGRLFDARDRADGQPVVIIDDALARAHFAGVDPVGRWLQTGDPTPDATRLTIVGVVPDVKYTGLDGPSEPTIYVPYAQNRWWRSMYLIVRTRGEPMELAAPIRARIAAIDPRVPVREVNTVEQLASESVSTPRFRALLLGSFGGIALLLACAGIYGVLAYDVAQRRRETGIRIAIGADRRRIVAGIVGRGMRLAAIGIAIGGIAAAALTRLMAGLLFQVDPLDPVTFVAAIAILAGVGLAACAVPALRAARTDPMGVLRAE